MRRAPFVTALVATMTALTAPASAGVVLNTIDRALGVTRRAGVVTDAKQWCQAIRLTFES